MARAVAGWSPVIMTVRMPALRASAMAAATSGRGGSTMPTRPMKVRLCFPLGRCDDRAERHRQPFAHGERDDAHRAPGPLGRLAGDGVAIVVGERLGEAVAQDGGRALEQHLGRAAHVGADRLSPPTSTEAMRRCEVNGCSARMRVCSHLTSTRWLMMSSAASVGSPWISTRPSDNSVTCAPRACAAASRATLRSMLSGRPGLSSRLIAEGVAG